MRQWLRSHLTYANVMVTILAFIVLTGGTAVALSGSNTVFTDDIANDTQPASGGNPAGGLVAADLRTSSVGTLEVAADSLGAGDLAPSSVGTSEVAADSLSGADIANTSSLTGSEINEASLAGVAHTAGASPSGCCEIIGEPVTTSDPYSPSDFDTWVSLGNFHLRSPASDNSAGSGFRLCNTASAGLDAFVYVGGSSTSTADTRSNPVVDGGTCTTVDYNGSDTDAFGDFRVYLPVANSVGDSVAVFGVGYGTGMSGAIQIIAIST